MNIPAQDIRARRHGSAWPRLFERLPRWGGLQTIRGHLFIALGATAAMTVICTSIAFYTFRTVGRTTAEIAQRNFPAAVQSFHLSKVASALVAYVPRLLTTPNQQRRKEIFDSIELQVNGLEQRIATLGEFDPAHKSDLQDAQDDLVEKLETLNKTIAERISFSQKRIAEVIATRKTHESFLEVITPLIDDANYNLMTDEAIGTKLQAKLLETLAGLLDMQAQANLLAGFLIESSLVNDTARLQPLSEQIDAARRKIDEDLKSLPTLMRAKLSMAVEEFALEAKRSGVLGLRAAELKAESKARTDFASAQAAAAKLREIIDLLVQRESKTAEQAVERAGEQIFSGKVILILLSLAAILCAGLIAWLYVGRNIARRLTSLSEAMQQIAQGNLDVEIDDRGHDEIDEMARTLRVFRQASADVAARKRRNSTARTSRRRGDKRSSARSAISRRSLPGWCARSARPRKP